MKTTLKKVGGWTPIIDTLALDPKYGLKGAAVFGVVWRHCQMRDGVCKASLDRMGELVGIKTRDTIIKYLKRLVKDGYLIDTTPGIKNVPHTYKDAGKLNMAISLEIEPSDQQTGVELPDTSIGVENGVELGVETGVEQLDMNTLNTLKEDKEKKEKTSLTPSFVDGKKSSTKKCDEVGLIVKVAKALKEDNREPILDAVKEAIVLWKEEVDRHNKIKEPDENTWHYSNLGAILERYDVLVTSNNAMIGKQNVYIRTDKTTTLVSIVPDDIPLEVDVSQTFETEPVYVPAPPEPTRLDKCDLRADRLSIFPGGAP